MNHTFLPAAWRRLQEKVEGLRQKLENCQDSAELAVLVAQLNELLTILNNSSQVTPGSLPGGEDTQVARQVVDIGTIITAIDPTTQKPTDFFVGSSLVHLDEVSLPENTLRLSCDAPLARAFLGAAPGDRVHFQTGDEQVTIVVSKVTTPEAL